MVECKRHILWKRFREAMLERIRARNIGHIAAANSKCKGRALVAVLEGGRVCANRIEELVALFSIWTSLVGKCSAFTSARPLIIHSFSNHRLPVSMASKTPLRTLLSTANSTLRSSQPVRRAFPETSACAFSTITPTRAPEYDTEAAERPRWQQTPARMTAPFRTRPLPRGPVFKVNEDPRRLDDAYIRMLGTNGDKMLSDEVKWLAVTHKSFDHGRRGFNDRLAFLGMLECTTRLRDESANHGSTQVDE